MTLFVSALQWGSRSAGWDARQNPAAADICWNPRHHCPSGSRFQQPCLFSRGQQRFHFSFTCNAHPAVYQAQIPGPWAASLLRNACLRGMWPLHRPPLTFHEGTFPPQSGWLRVHPGTGCCCCHHRWLAAHASDRRLVYECRYYYARLPSCLPPSCTWQLHLTGLSSRCSAHEQLSAIPLCFCTPL